MLDIFETDIPQLTGDELRKVYVYKPDKRGKYPVLYMFDGHNLFYDEEASYLILSLQNAGHPVLSSFHIEGQEKVVVEELIVEE